MFVNLNLLMLTGCTASDSDNISGCMWMVFTKYSIYECCMRDGNVETGSQSEKIIISVWEYG
jgi:hypothetical protein